MPRINPEGQLTRAERLANVIAVAVAVLLHVVVILGWGRLSHWTQEEQKKERLMVIRRVREIAPPPETAPAPPRQRLTPAAPREEGLTPSGARAPSPSAEPKVREPGPEPPKESELSPEMEEDLEGQERDQEVAPEPGNSSVSVVTDLPAASFVVAAAAQRYRGAGTFWVRKGVPPGTYTATFNPVPGFGTPAVQTKELVPRGQIVFVGKYRRSTEVIVDCNLKVAPVTLFRPDGQQIEMTCPSRSLLYDLPLGRYTAVFKEVPGYVTPPPVPKDLAPGGKLQFYGRYDEVRRAAAQGSADAGRAAGEEGKAALAKQQPQRIAKKAAPAVEERGLDRRVQMVVKSYPPTDIEEVYDPIPYPEVIIRRSNFQQGWCQVYLIVNIDGDGEVSRIAIERPTRESRAQFSALIGAVEAAVRSWDYDRVKAEVHVDVRFYVE